VSSRSGDLLYPITDFTPVALLTLTVNLLSVSMREPGQFSQLLAVVMVTAVRVITLNVTSSKD